MSINKFAAMMENHPAIFKRLTSVAFMLPLIMVSHGQLLLTFYQVAAPIALLNNVLINGTMFISDYCLIDVIRQLVSVSHRGVQFQQEGALYILISCSTIRFFGFRL